MWSRVDQGPGIHVVTEAVQKGATSKYFQHVCILTVHKMYVPLENHWLSATKQETVTSLILVFPMHENTKFWLISLIMLNSKSPPMSAWVFVVGKSEN